MAIMKATYDSGKNEVLYVKIRGRLQELSLDTPFVPKWPKCSFYAPDSREAIYFKISCLY